MGQDNLFISRHSTDTRTFHLLGYVGTFQLVCSKLLDAKSGIFSENVILGFKKEKFKLEQIPFSTRDWLNIYEMGC